MATKNKIYLIEVNGRGAYVIYGSIGIKQYYYYTKKEAMKMYRNEKQWYKYPEMI